MKPQNGFTLLELLVVVAIVALLVSIASPNLGTPVNQRKLDAAAEVVRGALASARMEASLRGKVVSVQGKDGGDWVDSVESFIDTGGEGAEQFSAASDVKLNTYRIDSSSLSIDVAGASSGILSFNSLGALTQPGIVVIQVCSSDPRLKGVNLTVNAVGRVKTQMGVTCPS